MEELLKELRRPCRLVPPTIDIVEDRTTKTLMFWARYPLSTYGQIEATGETLNECLENYDAEWENLSLADAPEGASLI